MKKLFLTYILPCLSLLLVSCQDDFLPKDYQNTGEDEEGSMMISFMIEDPSIRTRVVDMTPGTAVYIDKVWVGIYDRVEGTRVGGTKLDDDHQTTLDHRLTAAQVKIPNAIPIEWYDAASSLRWDGDERDLCVVCIANYDNPDEGLSIYTDKKGSDKDGKQTLWSALKEADTWEKFIDIAIDCNSDGFTSGKPMLMGYLYKDTNQTTTFTKVDQFKSDGTDNAIRLYPTGESEDELKYVNAKLTNNLPTGLKMDNYLVKLRRLRSRINVKIETRDADMTVTYLQYAVFNKPNSIFLAQRRTNRFAAGNYGVDYLNISKSANSSDVHNDDLREDAENFKVTGYTSDFNSSSKEVLWQTPINLKDFAFDHFENKHWTIRNEWDNEEEKEIDNLNKNEDESPINNIYDVYHNRERNIDNYTFWALADSKEFWNNNASYFVLKMGLLDKATGESAEVQYTIHEGFCNDYDGNEYKLSAFNNDELEWMKAKAKDFSCVRNTNYTYNIQINNIKDITYHVTGEDGYSNHSNDQLGDTWRMKYLNTTSDSRDRVGNRLKANTWDDNYTIKVTDDISFADALPKDIAFRIIGEYKDENGNFVPADFCYNFARGDLDGFANLWTKPSVYTEYIIDPKYEDPFSYLQSYKDDIALNKIMSLIKVKMSDLTTGFDENDVDEEGYITIYKYIEKLFENEANTKLDSSYDIEGFKLASHNYYTLLSDEEAYIRGLYIFDREKAILQGSRIVHDGNDEWFHTEDWLNGVASCKIYEIYAIEQLPKCITGFNYIFSSATGEEKISYEGGTYDYSKFNEGKGIELLNDPDIAFRLVQLDEEGNDFFDLCYNFELKDYPEMANYWPTATRATTTQEIKKGQLGTVTIPEELLNGMKIRVNNNSSINISQFIATYEGNNNIEGNNVKFGFDIGKYEHKQVRDPEGYMRALYIFDKKTFESTNFLDPNDRINRKFYAAEQYPDFDERINVIFDASSMIWDNEFVKLYNTNVYTRDKDKNYALNQTPKERYDENHWFGGRETTTEMHWIHWPGVTGYKIQIIDFAKEEIKTGIYEQLTITDAEARFKNYIETKPNGEEIFHCPFTTTRYSPGAYDVIITPYVDPLIVKNNPQPFTAEKALVIQEDQVNNVTTWDFSQYPWSNLAVEDFDYNNPKPLEYNGLRLYHSSQGSNVFPSTQTGNSKYIRFGANGVADEKNKDHCIEIYLHEPGELFVTVSSNGGLKDDRDVYVYEEATGIKTKINTEYLESASATYKYDVNPQVNKDVPPSTPPSYIPSRYIIYCDKDAFFYKITFKRTR